MEKALERWFKNGLIDKKQYLDLLEDVKTQKEKSTKAKIQITLYIIGALLLGFGIIIFIQANDWLVEFFQRNNFIKISLSFLLAASSLFYGNKFLSEGSKYPRLGVSLIFLSTILIGGVWALLGQIYNIEANSFLITVIWFISVYPIAFVYNNNAVNILSMVLFITTVYLIYGKYCYFLYDFISSFCAIGLFIGTLLYSVANINEIKEKFNNFSMTYKTTGLFFIYTMLFILTFEEVTNQKAVALYSSIPLIAGVCLCIYNYFREKTKTEIFNAETFYISAVSIYAVVLLNTPSINNYVVGFIANALIILMIYLMYKYGFKIDNKRIVDLAKKFLYLYLIINYFRIGGKYLHSAILLIIAGIILLYFGIRNEMKKNKGTNN